MLAIEILNDTSAEENVDMDKYRVVFHLDERSQVRSKMVLKNIANVIADLGQGNVEIELVVNGEGVTALTQSSPYQEQIKELAAQGVRFVACANSLRQAGIPKEVLLERIAVVPAGVGELVRKQAEGWAYIRP